LLGEDLADPYGGAFRITKGLSTRHPDRVLTTPISEGAIMGVAGGLALAGDRPIVEFMFGDFIALAFDQILNFVTKSVGMYGQHKPMHTVIRCPVGGTRGYGPTHSQSPQKHLMGIPHLALFELSPFVDSVVALAGLLDRGEPCVLFEHKALYAQRRHVDDVVDDLFSYDFLDDAQTCARLFIASPDEADVVMIVPGGVVDRARAAARELFVRDEIRCQLIVPFQLYPVDIEPWFAGVSSAGTVCVVEESTAGGTWGAEVASQLYQRVWHRLRRPIVQVHSRDSVIPAARHLEDQVLVQAATIYDAVRRGIEEPSGV
jgi:pyruvate dehydrogenase E1 component beta subunit